MKNKQFEPIAHISGVDVLYSFSEVGHGSEQDKAATRIAARYNAGDCDEDVRIILESWENWKKENKL